MIGVRFGVQVMIDGDDDEGDRGCYWFPFGVPVPDVGEVLTCYYAHPDSRDDEPLDDKPTTRRRVIRREFGYRAGGGRTEGWVTLYVTRESVE